MNKHSIQYLFLKILTVISIAYTNGIQQTLDNATFAGRIVNGEDCDLEDFPYMVSIRYTHTLSHNCGGSLLSEYWVLTAGHCCRVNYIKGQFTAVAGATFSDNRIEVGVQKSLVVQNHPFIEDNHDVGLMRLADPIKESMFVHFVRLAPPKLNDSILATYCEKNIVVGWGQQFAKDSSNNLITRPVKGYNPHLQCVTLSLIPREICGKFYGYSLSASTMCTFGRSKDACQGDSGGPLICNNAQFGIVSAGVGCAYKTYPGLYMRVDRYRAFIHKTIIENCCMPRFCLKVSIFMYLLYIVCVLYFK